MGRAGVERAGGERAIVVVGAPLGAARAAAMFLVGLPEALPLPIVLMLGGGAEDHRELGINLQAHCALPLRPNPPPFGDVSPAVATTCPSTLPSLSGVKACCSKRHKGRCCARICFIKRATSLRLLRRTWLAVRTKRCRNIRREFWRTMCRTRR